MPSLALPAGPAGPTYSPVPDQNGQYSFPSGSGTPNQNGQYTNGGNSASYLAGLQALAGGSGSGGGPSAAMQSSMLGGLLTGSGDSGAAAVHAATVGQTPPTWQEIIQQAVMAAIGPQPTPVTAVSQGAAPTLSQYWDPTPYTNASNAVQQGGVTGISTINNAYAQALQSALAQGAVATKAEAGVGAQAQQDASAAGNSEHAAIATALQGGSGNSLLGNQLNAQQQTLDQNNQRGVNTAQYLQGLVAANNAGNQQAIGSSKANALQFLGSQVQGELGKIGFAQADAQSTAQRQFQAAQNAFNTNSQNAANSAADATSKNNATYASSYTDALKQAQAAALSTATSGRDSVMNEINGGTLDPLVSGAFTSAIFGDTTTGQGAARDLPEALSRLSPNAPAQLKNLVTQYFETTKQPNASALEAYLSGMSG